MSQPISLKFEILGKYTFTILRTRPQNGRELGIPAGFLYTLMMKLVENGKRNVTEKNHLLKRNVLLVKRSAKLKRAKR
jgi:hypothetical protein